MDVVSAQQPGGVFAESVRAVKFSRDSRIVFTCCGQVLVVPGWPLADTNPVLNMRASFRKLSRCTKWHAQIFEMLGVLRISSPQYHIYYCKPFPTPSPSRFPGQTRRGGTVASQSHRYRRGGLGSRSSKSCQRDQQSGVVVPKAGDILYLVELLQLGGIAGKIFLGSEDAVLTRIRLYWVVHCIPGQLRRG